MYKLISCQQRWPAYNLEIICRRYISRHFHAYIWGVMNIFDDEPEAPQSPGDSTNNTTKSKVDPQTKLEVQLERRGMGPITVEERQELVRNIIYSVILVVKPFSESYGTISIGGLICIVILNKN